MSTLGEVLVGKSTPYKAMANSLASSIRVSMPGIIQSFNAGNQTVNVKPAVSDSIMEKGKQKWVALPIILDVPVAFPRGGNYAVTLPIKAGDACILIFSDSCIDGFCQSGEESTQAEIRHHDLSDAMAVVGISTGNAPFPAYDPENLEIRHKEEEIKITLSEDSINLKFKESSIKMSESEIKITSGTVDINGTVF